MKISYLLTSFVAWGCFFNSQALAATPSCATPPSCESLGYTMSTDQCAGFMLKCPFDQSKAFCASYKSGSGICDPGMIYDMTVHKCYNEMPTTNIANLYYIVERNGNDGIMLHLNKLGTDSTTKTYGDELKTMASQTIEANSREYFTSEELRKIWGKTPLVSGVASLYAKVGRTFSSVFVKGGIINLNADLSYDFYTRAWSTFSNSNYEYVNKNIFKVPVDLTGASNGTITPVTYKVDVEFPQTGSYVEYNIDGRSCSEVKSGATNIACPSDSVGMATLTEIKNAFGTNAAVSAFLGEKKGGRYPVAIATDGCMYFNKNDTLVSIAKSTDLEDYGYSGYNDITITVYSFCKYAQ